MTSLEQNTKEKILTAALDLFSVRGYTAVSVRDICKIVEIKESSIYYHFKNKGDILQTLLQQAEQQTQALKNSFNHALSVAVKVDCEGFIGAGIAYLETYLLQEKIYKLIRMLTIEKQTNADAASMYHELLIAVPLAHQTKVFAFLMEKDYIHPDDPACLAAEYQAIITYIFQKYFSGPGPVTLNTKSAAKHELITLLERFFFRYFEEGYPL